jgi:hypothetical protein
MYEMRKGGPYIRNPANFRVLNDELIHNIKEGEKYQLKYLKGERMEAGESNFIGNLGNKGYHPINNPFFGAPFGSHNSIYNSPTDLMHLFSAGLIKSVLFWTLTIIDAISKCDYNEGMFAQNAGLFDIRLKQFPVLPKNIPHLYMRKFNTGLMDLVTKQSKKNKSYATGAGGGFRSVDFVSALFQARFAVSDHIISNSSLCNL